MRLAFHDDGPGPVVVLIHGFPLDRSLWSHQRSSIGSIYRLITPDCRGFGGSPGPLGISTVDAMADDVIELLDDLQLVQPLAIGGLSMGGYLALSIATRFPDRVKGLILLNSRAEADSPETSRNRQATADQIEASSDPTAFLDGMVSKLFANTTKTNQPQLVRDWRSKMAKIPVETIVSTLRGLAIRPDRTADLLRIKVPTLVIAGSDDLIVPIEETRRMTAAIPDARMVVVPEAGHLTPLENPRDTDRALLEFLERLG